MKLSAWHKKNGDQVEWYDPLTAWLNPPDIGNSYSQYLKTSSTSTGTIAINGGEVTYTPKNGAEVTNMVDGKEYTWIAIGE